MAINNANTVVQTINNSAKILGLVNKAAKDAAAQIYASKTTTTGGK